MKVSHHDASVGIIEKIHHWTMPTWDENRVVLIEPRCDDLRDTSRTSEPSQAVAEFQIVLELSLVPTEELGYRGIDVQLRRVAFGVGEGDFVALLHQGANRNGQLVEVVPSALINLAIFQGQTATARYQH